MTEMVHCWGVLTSVYRLQGSVPMPGIFADPFLGGSCVKVYMTCRRHRRCHTRPWGLLATEAAAAPEVSSLP